MSCQLTPFFPSSFRLWRIASFESFDVVLWAGKKLSDFGIGWSSNSLEDHPIPKLLSCQLTPFFSSSFKLWRIASFWSFDVMLWAGKKLSDFGIGWSSKLLTLQEIYLNTHPFNNFFFFFFSCITYIYIYIYIFGYMANWQCNFLWDFIV